ncbi:MAG: M48 family metallopeptidase [Cyanobacteria bacterium]|nr:M48 family metallopeptidase [Cyanobacteriota bacterium]
MENFGWAFNFYVIISILTIFMLLSIIGAVLFSKTSESKDALKYFNEAFLIKAAAYNKMTLLISIAERFIIWAFMAGMIYTFWRNFYFNNRIPIILALVLFVIFYISLTLIILPLQYYSGFVINHKFALSNQTLSSWFADTFKDKAISLIINSSALTIGYSLAVHIPRQWWIAAAAIFILFIIFANFISPIVIDPLFYKFSILEDKELKDNIMRIAEKAGFTVGDILVADASKRTNMVNAYFTGLGKTKRIVIYDNLLNKYSKKEVLSVIAHEIGHWKFKHIFKSIILYSAGTIILFFIFYQVKNKFSPVINIKLVLIIFILFSMINYITVPLQNLVSRYFESQADKYAIELTGDPATQVSLFEKLAISNLAEADPNTVLKYLIYSHPPIIERIKNALK